MENLLRNQLLAAVDPIYVDELRQDYTHFARVPVRKLLQHLDTRYAKIGPEDLKANDARMASPYDPSQPFERFVRQIQDA